MSGSEMIDWGLAERVALKVAGDGTAGRRPDPRLEEFADAAEAVLGYTRLSLTEPLPEAESVDRAEWIRINLEGFKAAAGLIQVRIGERLRETGPLGAALPSLLGRVAAVEVGALLGYSSRRVLGQYEYPILADPAEQRAPRLLFLSENIETARAELNANPEALLRWIALHEVTHAVHFSAAPWLRAHLGALAREMIENADVGPSRDELVAAGKRVLSEDPRRLLAELRASDPMTLLAPASVRPLIAEIQATMAMVEGYAEHVMDAAAGSIGDEVEALRRALDKRRADKGGLARLLAWLLGMELKMRQYRDGKVFVDEIVAKTDIETLNLAWNGPADLPTNAELKRPGDWLERVEQQRTAQRGRKAPGSGAPLVS